MKFADIPYHEDAKERLRAMIDSDRIPHALLIEGPAGIGKFALARAAAQYIHCENKIDGDSCGKCPSCLQHNSFNHIDTHFAFPVIKKKSDRASFCDDFIAEWRDYLSENQYMDFQKWVEALGSPTTQPQIYADEADALIRKLSFTSHSSRYKVVLMWLPERLNVTGANKLLKQIEEPYPDTIFILVSNKPAEILPTIYSRTQRLQLKRLPDHVVAKYLSENFSVDLTDATALAHIAEGNIITAVNGLILSKENKNYLDKFMSLMRLAYQRNVKELKEWASEISSLGRESELRYLEYCQRLIRENFIYNLQISELNYLNRDEAAFSHNFARFINERNVVQIAAELDKAAIDIAGNANGKIVMFDVAVRMILLLKQ